MITAPPGTYPVYSVGFWKAYVIQMRPYLLFISGIAGLAGMVISKTEQVEWWRVLIAFIPFFFGYGFGQALTDCFQTDTDKLSAPYRPLSQGIVSVNSVFTVSIIGLFCCAIILYWMHFMSFILSCISVFGLATYSYIKRNFWFGGPFYNAWIVALLTIMGYFALSTPETRTFPIHLLPFVLVSFFSYASFVLIGYLKDIDADRITNYKTFPVVWGWNSSILLGDLFALASIFFILFQPLNNVFAIIAAAIASATILYGQIVGHTTKNKNERGALIPILSTVRSFIFFHIAIVLHFQQSWWLYMIIYYILFELILFKRPSRYQV